MKVISNYHVLIIDDELPARLRLKKLISDYPGFLDLIGEAANGDEAVDIINELKPDLIFLDIQMPGINGFEVLEKINFQPVVIFCTAFDHYALKAFDSCCADYLVKPVSEQRFAVMVDKLKLLNPEKKTDIGKLMEIISASRKKEEITSLPVNLGDKIIFIRLEDVSYFTTDEKYVTVYTKQSKSYIITQSLKKLEEKLPEYFLRVHKSFIINRKLIAEVHRHFNNRYVIVLDDYSRTRITSGRNYYTPLKSEFEL